MRDDPIQEAVALLQSRREDVVRMLADIDRGIERLTADSDGSSERATSVNGTTATKSIRNQILAAMPEPRTYTADEIVNAVQGQEASVRSILSRLTRAGDLRSLARGQYERTDLIPDTPVRAGQIEDVEEVIDESDVSGLPNAAQDANLT